MIEYGVGSLDQLVDTKNELESLWNTLLAEEK
jgi:hypothetical protein